jgi:hypothetical protein
MRELSNSLKSLLQNDTDIYNLTDIMYNEDYIDEDGLPLLCQYCDSSNIEKIYKVDFDNIDEKYKKQILEIYPTIESSIITFWVCRDCDSVLAIKRYANVSKKILHHKFDKRTAIINDLKEKGYIDEECKPLKCWYCQSTNFSSKKDEYNVDYICCIDCKKELAKKLDKDWIVEI